MQHRKFLFDLSFDPPEERFEPAAPAPEPEPLLPPEPDPALIEAVRAAARAEGEDEGYARGRADAAASEAAKTATALALIGEGLQTLLSRIDAGEAARSAEAARIVATIARRMVPALARRSGFAEIEAVVAESLRRAVDEPRIVVRVPDAMFDEARARIDPLAQRAGFAGRVIILAEPSLGAYDCRVEWADGGMERDGARLWRDIENALRPALAAGDPEPFAADAA